MTDDGCSDGLIKERARTCNHDLYLRLRVVFAIPAISVVASISARRALQKEVHVAYHARSVKQAVAVRGGVVIRLGPREDDECQF